MFIFQLNACEQEQVHFVHQNAHAAFILAQISFTFEK